MILREDVLKILEAGTMAPSGDNIQPWRFELQADGFLLHNVPDVDRSLYNFQQNASWVAHGILVETIYVFAPSLGYETEIQWFPFSQDHNVVAKVSFKKTATNPNSLAKVISKRCTNRKPYQHVSLTDRQRGVLYDIGSSGFDAISILIDNDDQKKIIARAASQNEKLLFKNTYMRELFFCNLRWTAEEELYARTGLYLKALEIPVPMMLIFKIMRHKIWGRLLARLGIPELIAFGNAHLYATASIIGAITIQSNGPKDFIAAGRLLQRLWLASTREGLSFQPMTGIPFLYQRIAQKNHQYFDQEDIALIKKSYQVLEQTFHAMNKTIALVFRIGLASPPSAQTSRLSLSQLIMN